MARNDPQVNFRIPADLKDKLQQSADENSRSITAELVLRLENSFQQVRDTQATQDEILQAIADAKTEIKAEIQSLKR